jgi:hypothetical protein
MLSNRLSKVVAGSLKVGCKVLGVGLVLTAVAGRAAAFDNGTGLDAPEIDPGSMSSALTLLVSGVLLLTDRIRRK